MKSGVKAGKKLLVLIVLLAQCSIVSAGLKEDLDDKQKMDSENLDGFMEIAAYSARLTDFQLLKTCKRGGAVPHITRHCVHEMIGGHVCCWCGVTISEANLHGPWKP
mgnify:CR=1 FL=1